MLLINAENILKKRSYYSLKTLITVINRGLELLLIYLYLKFSILLFTINEISTLIISL